MPVLSSSPRNILVPKFNQYRERQLWRRDCNMADSHNFLLEGEFFFTKYVLAHSDTSRGERGNYWLVGWFFRTMQSVPVIYNKMNAVSRWLKFTFLRLSVWHDNFIRCHDDLYCRPKETILNILYLQSDGIRLFLNRWEFSHDRRTLFIVVSEFFNVVSLNP